MWNWPPVSASAKDEVKIRSGQRAQPIVNANLKGEVGRAVALTVHFDPEMRRGFVQRLDPRFHSSTSGKRGIADKDHIGIAHGDTVALVAVEIDDVRAVELRRVVVEFKRERIRTGAADQLGKTTFVLAHAVAVAIGDQKQIVARATQGDVEIARAGIDGVIAAAAVDVVRSLKNCETPCRRHCR